MQADGTFSSDKHLLIVTQNASTDSPWSISTNPRGKYNDPARPDCNLRIPLWKLVRASTAAPIFFSPEEIHFTPGDDDLAPVERLPRLVENTKHWRWLDVEAGASAIHA
jgi:hypothetical protein